MHKSAFYSPILSSHRLAPVQSSPPARLTQSSQSDQDATRFLLVKHAQLPLRDLTKELPPSLAFVKSLSPSSLLIAFFNLCECIDAHAFCSTLSQSVSYVSSDFVSSVLNATVLPPWVTTNNGWIWIQGLKSPTWTCQKVLHILAPFGPTKSVYQDNQDWSVEFFDVRDAASALKGLDGLHLNDNGDQVRVHFGRKGTDTVTPHDRALEDAFDRLLLDDQLWSPSEQVDSYFDLPSGLASPFESPQREEFSLLGTRMQSPRRRPFEDVWSPRHLDASTPGTAPHERPWTQLPSPSRSMSNMDQWSPGRESARASAMTDSPRRLYMTPSRELLSPVASPSKDEERETLSASSRLQSPDYFSWPSANAPARTPPIHAWETESGKENIKVGDDQQKGNRSTDSKGNASPAEPTTAPDAGSNELNYDAISSGKDKRTTFMIRNIPNKYTQQMLIEFLNETHAGHFNFLYLRMDFKNKCNVGYAFINFPRPESVISLADRILGKKCDKVATLCYANVQGYQQLVEKFRNSSVMLEEPAFRPKIFCTEGSQKGEELSFPSPSMRVRPKVDVLFSRGE